MNKKQLEQFEDYALEIKHNRDSYSRAWIIEALVKKATELVNKTDLLPDGEACDCTHTQACNVCAESKGIDWNIIQKYYD